MNLVDRAKNIILKPRSEWNEIDQEPNSVFLLTIKYLIPLAVIPAAATFISFFFGSASTLMWGVKQAILSFVSIIIGVFISAFTISSLAQNFDSKKSFRRASLLVIYSYTPFLLASAFKAIPDLSLLSIAGLYGLYILYVGVKPMMKTPDEKVTTYYAVCLIAIVAIYFIFTSILSLIIIGRTIGVTPVMR